MKASIIPDLIELPIETEPDGTCLKAYAYAVTAELRLPPGDIENVSPGVVITTAASAIREALYGDIREMILELDRVAGLPKPSGVPWKDHAQSIAGRVRGLLAYVYALTEEPQGTAAESAYRKTLN